MCAAAATTGLDDQDQGLASGLFNTSQRIGGALGLRLANRTARRPLCEAGDE
jgi:hypothetical protein